jgi:hypothetical protein
MEAMTTPNTPSPTTDLHADALASDERGTNVGEMISEKPDHLSERQTPTRSRCNVGRTEQKIRLGAGAALLAAAGFAPVSRKSRIAFAALGAAELITGAMRYCPVSQALGINTCRDDER